MNLPKGTKYTETMCVNCKKKFAKLRCPFCGFARKNIGTDGYYHGGDVQ